LATISASDGTAKSGVPMKTTLSGKGEILSVEERIVREWSWENRAGQGLSSSGVGGGRPLGLKRPFITELDSVIHHRSALSRSANLTNRLEMDHGVKRRDIGERGASRL
jgi:hypothetical protein